MANKYHTCSLRSVFIHVHAAAKNDFDFIRRIRGELCEAFLTVCSEIFDFAFFSPVS